MAAANSDKLRQGASGISTTLQSSISNSDTTLTPASVSNIPTLTAVDLTIDRVDSSGTLTPSKMERVIGVVSGGNIVSLLRGQDNTTAQSHSTGAVIEMMPTGKWSQDLVTWGLAHANQDGSLIGSAVRTALGQTASTGAGWTTLGATPSSVTCNGNRSYSVVFTGQDLTSSIAPGMRLMTQRTVAAPTQCTSLNGTTQYYSKTSPAGMTFVDDFTVSAWVKLSSYGANSTIASRYDGTSGWQFNIQSTGQVLLSGNNGGSGNFSNVLSYQSIPLNKWVHVSAQLDMSTFTATTTTSYIMIDGIDVPASVNRGGTNPVAVVQAGTLQVGAANSLQFFPGKIAQVAIYSAKVTQANIRATISQGLAGTETSLISAYSFNNSINDLNTTNANNLTANGSAVATNSDSPFTQQANGTPNGTLDYGIVQSATFSTDSTVVVQVPEGCTIPTSGGVSAVSYSGVKAPYGMPIQDIKWSIRSIMKTSNGQNSPVTNTRYNLGNFQLYVPIGEWNAMYKAHGEASTSSVATSVYSMPYTTLSTANNTESDTEWTTKSVTSNTATQSAMVYVARPLSVSSAATYYLNWYIDNSAFITSLTIAGNFVPSIIEAVNAYL